MGGGENVAHTAPVCLHRINLAVASTSKLMRRGLARSCHKINCAKFPHRRVAGTAFMKRCGGRAEHSALFGWLRLDGSCGPAGIETSIGCYTFRAPGITDYLTNGGRLEVVQRMA
jgi:hypothetical protein